MNPFFTWVGGKRSLVDAILSKFPHDYGRYIEVFGGGGAILFAKPITKFEIYNDFNNNLTNLFNVVKHKPLQFLKELNLFPFNSRYDFEALLNHLNYDIYGDEYYKEELEVGEQYLTPPQLEEVKRIYETRSENLDVKRAVIFFKIIKYSYASGCKSFSCQPQNIRKTFQDIERCSRRLQNVLVENKDFEDLIKQYDRDDALFYLDPPYWSTEGVYSNINFDRETHERLRNTLVNIKGRFILSYNDCPEIRELYKDFKIIEVKRINNMAQRYEAGSEFCELIIMNFEPKSAVSQLQLEF